MRKTIFTLTAVGFLFVIAVGTNAQNNLPEPSGKALWDYLRKTDYTNWQIWPGKTPFYRGTEPHGALLTTYVNQPAFRAITGNVQNLPHGSLIVKENYTPERKMAAITVMDKVKGFNPEGNDWFWAKYSPDGQVQSSGKVDSCIKCHGRKKENDYIWTERL